MQKIRTGQHIIVTLPDDTTIEGTLLRMSPDRRHCLVRLYDGLELLTETQFIETLPKTYGNGTQGEFNSSDNAPNPSQ